MKKVICDEAEMAKFIDVSPRKLRDLAERKIAIRVAPGRYDREQSIRNYVHHLRCVCAAVEDGLPGDSYTE
jgi:hypothetical protein